MLRKFDRVYCAISSQNKRVAKERSMETVGKTLFLALFIGILAAACKPDEKPSAPNVSRVSEILPVVFENQQLKSAWLDTAKIHALFSELSQIDKPNLDSAIHSYHRLLTLCKEAHYFPGVVNAYHRLAYCYQQLGKLEYARHYLLNGVSYLQFILSTGQINNLVALRKAYSSLTAFYTHLGENKQVIQASLKALSLYNPEDSTQKAGYLKTKLSLAHGYLNTSRFDSASLLYLELLSDFHPISKTNYVEAIYIYLGLGTSAQKMNPEKALDYFNEAEEIARNYQDTGFIVQALNKKAVYYYESENFQAAKALAKQTAALIDQVPSGLIQVESRFQNAYAFAVCLMGEDQPQEALPYSLRAFQYAAQMQFEIHQITATYLLGYNYYKVGRYTKAENLLKESIRLGEATDQKTVLADIYWTLGATYARLGKFEKAYAANLRYYSLWDSLKNKETLSRIAEAESKYQIAEQSKRLAQSQLQIANQQLEIKNQYILVTVVSAGACLIILILSLILRRRKHRSQLETLKARLAGEEEERGRLARELHDGIVSQLSIIKTNLCTLPASNRNPEEQQHFLEVIAQLDQGIAELRRTSHNLLPDIIKQAGLFGALEFYCRKITQSGVLDIEFQPVGALPDLEKPFQLNIYRIVQELVSNIIKHAQATTALMQVAVREETLEITIDDNGSHAYEASGISPGIGLQNLQSRLKLTGGTIEIERNGGTSVYLSFDLRNFIVPVA